MAELIVSQSCHHFIYFGCHHPSCFTFLEELGAGFLVCFVVVKIFQAFRPRGPKEVLISLKPANYSRKTMVNATLHHHSNIYILLYYDKLYIALQLKFHVGFVIPTKHLPNQKIVC